MDPWGLIGSGVHRRETSDEGVFVLFHLFPVVGASGLEAGEEGVFTDLIDDQAQGREEEVVLLGVLGAEQTLLTPEETIGGVLVAADVEQCGRFKAGFGDVAAGRGDRLVLSGLEVVGGHVREHALTGETTATDPLALLGHETTPEGEMEKDGVDGVVSQGETNRMSAPWGSAGTSRHLATGSGVLMRLLAAAQGIPRQGATRRHPRGCLRTAEGRGSLCCSLVCRKVQPMRSPQNLEVRSRTAK